MKQIKWLLIFVGLFMGCSTPDVKTALPERFANWQLPTPSGEYDTRVPLVWLGANGVEAVLGTGSSFTIADKDPDAPQTMGMPASPSELGDELAMAHMAAEETAVIIVSDEVGAIQSVAASVQLWADITPDNFALFAGREVQGVGKQIGDIFAYTLEPLETTEDVLLVVSIIFDNSRASGDIILIWRLNPSTAGSEPVLDTMRFTDALRAAGATAEPAGPFNAAFFTGETLLIKVNGVDIQVYEYADSAIAEQEARHAAPDGELIIPVEWVATPHFYQSGRLIVQYIGDDLTIIALLESVLGLQFAGGPL